MELNITRFFNEAEPFEYSASQAERGENVGRETWEAAVAAHDEFPLLQNSMQRIAARQWLSEFGAWSEDEIAAWSDAELNALMIQYIAGDIREMQSLCDEDWQEYEKLAQAGTVSGRMWKNVDGEIYFYIGS